MSSHLSLTHITVLVCKKKVSKYKYPGILFTHDFLWSKYIDLACNKALRRLGYLQPTLLPAPKATKLLTYKTLVRPMLEYG